MVLIWNFGTAALIVAIGTCFGRQLLSQGRSAALS